MALRAHESLVHDLHDQLVVAPAEGSGHTRQASIAREIWRRVDLEDVGLTFLAETHVHPAVSLKFGHVLPGPAGDIPNDLEQLRWQVSGTDRYRCLVLGAAGDPLGR